jgi:hypothetical protein
MAKSAHPGFKVVQGQIAQREGIPEARAGAILASATRKASPAAKAKNPRLKRVKGKARGKKPPTTTAYMGGDKFGNF